MPRKQHSIVINTDGACSGNPGPGGFAAIVVIDGHETSVTGGDPATTNNRMELAAVIEGLRFAQKAPANAGVPIEVRSDSTYVVHAFNKGWINKWKRDGFHTRTNGDLWEALDKLTVGQDITWTWVRGHSGDAMNERCDRLAVARAAAAPGRRTYWVDDQPVPTPQAPAPAPVSESQKEQTPPEEAYPAPNTGSPIGDALEQNSRAATCAELALHRMEAGNPEDAWKVMHTALAQLAHQQTILEQLRRDAGQSQK